MSIQWTIIAVFLYAEITIVLLLLVPLISPTRWQTFFKSRFLRSLEKQANIYFSIFIGILVLFFIDAIREMRKYGEEMEAIHLDSHLSAELQTHMKLFRAQRNFFISGFALFLWLVLRRLVTLLSSIATLKADSDAAMRQAKSATDAAQKLLDAKARDESGESADNEGNIAKEEFEKELDLLRHKLQETEDELKRSKVDVLTMKKQSESLTVEYDRLSEEHATLQNKYDRLVGAEGSKKEE